MIRIDGSARISGLTLTINGDRNEIAIGRVEIRGAGVILGGSANCVRIADHCMLRGMGVVTEDDGNAVVIGAHTQIHGATSLAALEGTRILIGDDCLFSGGIHLRTGDSHSLVDLGGRRVNPSKDIVLGNHVWVGMNVTILKGSRVPDHSVVAACALVTGAFDEPHVAIGGSPARVIRTGIDWLSERIPYS